LTSVAVLLIVQGQHDEQVDVPDDIFGESVSFNRPRLQILKPTNGEVLETSDLEIKVSVEGYDLPSILRDSKICLGLAVEGERIMETCFEQTFDKVFHATGLAAGQNYMLRVVLFDRSNAVAVSVRSFRVGAVSVSSDESTTIKTALQLALASHEEGDRHAALNIYRQIVLQRPNHADALHLLGVALYQNGDARGAIPFIERAIHTNTSFENFHNSMGECLRAIGRPREAVGQYELALNLRSDFPEAHFNLGLAWQQLHEWDKAVVQYESVATYATSVVAVANVDDGEEEQPRATIPDSVAHESRVRQCDLLQGLGRTDEARQCLEQGIRQWPQDGHLYNELGNVYLKAGKLRLASEFYGSAVHYGYGLASELNLGTVAELQGDHAEAIERHEKALAQAQAANLPRRHILIKLGTILPRVMPALQDELMSWRERSERRLDELLAMGGQQIDSDNAEPLNDGFSTGYYFAFHGENNRAIKTKLARVFIGYCPSLITGEFLREDNIMMKSHVTLREGAGSDDGMRRIRVGFVSRFFYSAHDVGQLMKGVITQLNRAKFEVFVFMLHASAGSSHRHSTAEASGTQWDPSCDGDDETTNAIARAVDRFIPLPAKLQICHEEIRRAKLDILVYPEIGLDPVTYFLAFGRLAPVQAAWWAHPDTTGIPNIDYFLSTHHEEGYESADRGGQKAHHAPQEAQGSGASMHAGSMHLGSTGIGSTTGIGTGARGSGSADGDGHAARRYSEHLFPMIGLGTYFYRPKLEGGGAYSSPQKTREELRQKLSLPKKFHLYTCPHPLEKFHPSFYEGIAGILNADKLGHVLVPTSRDKAEWIKLLMQRMQQRLGANSARVHFLELLVNRPTRKQELLSLLQASDMVLDTFPFGGVVSSFQVQIVHPQIVHPLFGRSYCASTLRPIVLCIHSLADRIVHPLFGRSYCASTLDDFLTLSSLPLQALSMGTPVVTMKGAHLNGRITYAMYQRMGIDDCIADSVQAYIHIALRLAHNTAARQALSSRILALNHKLFEDPRAVREWERFFTTVAKCGNKEGEEANFSGSGSGPCRTPR
jgi:predicted O-linked N-acetylglucosamine transferase (SPINDLY family)